MRPTRPSAVERAALDGVLPGQPATAARSKPQQGLIARITAHLMDAPSFLKRLVRSVVPSERRRAHKRSLHAIELCQALISERGELSGAVFARDALAAY